MRQTADEIISLWSELGTPQAQVDSNIVQFARDSPEQLGLHKEDLKRLSSRRDKLVSEKSQRERKLKELKENVAGLWDRLGVDESERKQFLAANRGCGLRQINEFEDELSRLNELKRQNLHLFVEDARFKLQELWDSLYFSEEEMLEFAPAFSDVYSDALLSAHEQEIARLETLKEQRAPILAAVDRHRTLIKEREDLEKSSQDASRLMAKGQKGEKRDPGKLLREEKMRKRITKELPKVEADLRKTLEGWEDEYGRPFCVHGLRYLDELDAMSAKAPPPRSKTPNALPPAREAPKSAGRAQSRAGTMRGAPPPRSKTPTATISRSAALNSSIMSSSISQHSSSNSHHTMKPTSPSKIPGAGASRLPMSTLRDGPNSPERKLTSAKSNPSMIKHGASRSVDVADFSSTIRSGSRMGPPPPAGRMQPPPKMKDLFIPPTPTPSGPPSDLQRSGSVIRHATPEDPYDDSASYRAQRPQTSYASSTMGPPPRPQYPRAEHSYASSISTNSRPMSRDHYPLAPPSRQTSNTSSIMTGSQASGSENWETYTDASDTEEVDATEAYYAKVRQQQQKPVMLVGGGGGGAGTLKRGIQSPWPRKKAREVNAEEVEGSEAGWTDDGDLGEVY